MVLQPYGQSLKLDPKIAEALDQRPVNTPLGVQPTIQELIDVIRSLANGKKAVGPDGIPVELLKIVLNGDPAVRQRLLDIVIGIWRGGEVPQQWKDATIKVLHKKIQGYLTGGARWQVIALDRHSSPQ